MPTSEELPINVPWKLVAASPDMMDTKYCNKQFPYAWRSSLAIYTYELSESELPKEYSDHHITYIKLACSITGYQPSKEETQRGFVSFPNVPTEEMKRIMSEYFACYGVLVNVAVFPDPLLQPKEVSPFTYPCIIDFEPKSRELIQAATEKGEVLTASFSEVKTDKTFIHTHTTKIGLELGGKATLGSNNPKGDAKSGSGDAKSGSGDAKSGWGAELNAKLSAGWEDSDQEKRTVQSDASRERKETQGTTTTISQMYNLLTGYHVGTNRAVFLMLPRPHTLQPTNRRTFAQGLRMIEGIQEFFLVVSMPKEITRYCIEVNLETGHFPEEVKLEYPKIEYETNSEKFWVIKFAGKDTWSENRVRIDTTKHLTNGWEVDRTKGDLPGHEGIREVKEMNETNGAAVDHLRDYDYRALDDSTVEVVGSIAGDVRIKGEGDDDANFKKLYEVFTRRPKTLVADALPKVTTPFLITSRSLCVCLGYVDLKLKESVSKSLGDSIVDVQKIIVPMGLLSSSTSSIESPQPIPNFEELLKEIQVAMTNSWRLPTRQVFGEVNFLDSDYFKDRIREVLPERELHIPISKLGVISEKVVNLLGEKCTIGDVLAMDIDAFAERTKLDVSEAIKERRKLLGYKK